MKSPVRQHLTCLLALFLVLAGVFAGLSLPIPRIPWQPRSSASITHGWNDLWVIAVRNLRVGLQLLLGAASLGVYSLAQLVTIGLTLGLLLGGAHDAGVSWTQVALLLGPHTPIEFAGFIVIGALEFEAAIIVYRKLRYDLMDVDRPALRRYACQAMIGFTLIAVAAIVEVYITGPLAKHAAASTPTIARKVAP